MPIGEKHDFKGVIDLISMKAFMADGKTATDIPADMKDAATEAHFALVEAAAEGEDTLLEKYLENGSLSDEELIRGLKRCGPIWGVCAGALWPRADMKLALRPLLNAIVDLMPSPAQRPAKVVVGRDGEEKLTCSDTGPLAAYIWKTTADPFVGKMTYFRVFSGSVQADARVWNQAKGVEERMSGLHFQRGKEQIPAKVIHAGDIGSVSKLTVSATGDTLQR